MDMSGKNRKQDLEKNVSIPFVSGQNVRIHGCLNTVVESSNRPNNVLYFQHNELKVIIETALKKCLRAVTLILKSIKVIIHICHVFSAAKHFFRYRQHVGRTGVSFGIPTHEQCCQLQNLLVGHGPQNYR